MAQTTLPHSGLNTPNYYIFNWTHKKLHGIIDKEQLHERKWTNSSKFQGGERFIYSNIKKQNTFQFLDRCRFNTFFQYTCLCKISFTHFTYTDQWRRSGGWQGGHMAPPKNFLRAKYTFGFLLKVTKKYKSGYKNWLIQKWPPTKKSLRRLWHRPTCRIFCNILNIYQVNLILIITNWSTATLDNNGSDNTYWTVDSQFTCYVPYSVFHNSLHKINLRFLNWP